MGAKKKAATPSVTATTIAGQKVNERRTNCRARAKMSWAFENGCGCW